MGEDRVAGGDDGGEEDGEGLEVAEEILCQRKFNSKKNRPLLYFSPLLTFFNSLQSSCLCFREEDFTSCLIDLKVKVVAFIIRKMR